MWEFYLSAVELGFLHGSNMVFQLLLSSARDAVPIVRDFIVDDARSMAQLAGKPLETGAPENPLRAPEAGADTSRTAS
jgi:hypothetical protein